MHANQAATPSPSIYREAEAEADTTPLNAPMGASLVGILLPSLRPGKEQGRRPNENNSKHPGRTSLELAELSCMNPPERGVLSAFPITKPHWPTA